MGEEEFLIERARQAVSAGTDEVIFLKASEVTESELAYATSPSLFGDSRTIVITDAEKVGEAISKQILAACVDPAPGMNIVVIYQANGRNYRKRKTPALVAKLSKIAEVHEAWELNEKQRQTWLAREFANLGVRPTPDVIDALSRGVGSDLRALASAASQLVADTNGHVTREAVAAFYSGTAEVQNWDIADAAVEGRTDAAVSTCRRALQLGASPVAIAFALSSKVSTLARIYNSRGEHLGMNPYALKQAQRVARRWSGDNITKAVILMDDLAAEVVGQGNDPTYAVEYAVRRIAELAR